MREQGSQCQQYNAQVEPGRDVANVPFVEGAFFLRCYQLATIDLRPSRDAGADREALAGICRLIVRQKGSRPDERHVADKNIEQLGKFIEVALAQNKSESGYPPMVWDGVAMPIERRDAMCETYAAENSCRPARCAVARTGQVIPRQAGPISWT